MAAPMYFTPFSPVYTDKPPAGQAKFCPGFTNLYPVKKFQKAPPYMEELCMAVKLTAARIHPYEEVL